MTHNHTHLPVLIPHVGVKSVVDSVAWYVDKLGFSQNAQSQFPPEMHGHVYLGPSVCESTCQIMFYPEKDEERLKKTCYPILIQLDEKGKGKEQVDEWREKLHKRGAKVDVEPTDQPWMCRDVRFKDPDGMCYPPGLPHSFSHLPMTQGTTLCSTPSLTNPNVASKCHSTCFQKKMLVTVYVVSWMPEK
jgi:uncharacterized glyoxalase superfamily protein PhnB